MRLRYIRQLIDQFRASQHTSVHVLELGCGSSIPATKFMLDNDTPTFSVTGNDISNAQLDLARKKLVGLKDRVMLVETDLLSLVFPNAAFDAVTGF